MFLLNFFQHVIRLSCLTRKRSLHLQLNSSTLLNLIALITSMFELFAKLDKHDNDRTFLRICDSHYFRFIKSNMKFSETSDRCDKKKL